MKTRALFLVAIVAQVVLVVCKPDFVRAQQLLWLGTLERGESSRALDVAAAESLVVVGWSSKNGLQRHAFRWTPQGGMQDLGTLDPASYSESAANAISPNGRFIVGVSDDSTGYDHAFLWAAGTGMTDLGVLPGYEHSNAQAVSLDGSVVVGYCERSTGGNPQHAVRWTTAQSGIETLDIPDDIPSRALDVSSDGSMVVGWMTLPDNTTVAFRWSPSNGLENLNQVVALPPSLPPSILVEAHGISPDGRFVVGVGFNGQTLLFEPFMIDSTTNQVRWLGLPSQQQIPFFYAQGNDVSADGTVVVGVAADVTRTTLRACRWSVEGGPEDLNTVYASLLADGSVLYEATAISQDGRFIVGYGLHGAAGRQEAFLLDTGTATAIAVDPAIPATFQLLQNVPNPFNPSTNIRFILPQRARVRLSVYDLLGRRIQTLVDTELEAGTHSVVWDGTDSAGRPVPGGLYLVRLQAAQHVLTGKMISLR